MADPVSAAMFVRAIEEIVDDLEKIACSRCEEVVAEIESERGVCNWCHEAEHQVQERYR